MYYIIRFSFSNILFFLLVDLDQIIFMTTKLLVLLWYGIVIVVCQQLAMYSFTHAHQDI
jgi:hypothetical protein